MRRAVLTLGGTLAGLAALLSFKTSPATSVADSAPLTPSSPTSSAGQPTSPATSSGTASAAGKSSGGAAAGGRVVTGKVISTPYGPTQVQVTLSGQKITAVKVLQQTNDGINSQQIDAGALPKLTSEALAAQSARIDAVSGASYTSTGYIQSLQSALDQAKA
jgi:uncharacterized protein with FMN-binding domain